MIRSSGHASASAPMQLWHLDLVSGAFPASGGERKLVTGIDDHSRFFIITKVVAEPAGRAVCTPFADGMTTYGVPSEVLTVNGKQFTGRYTKPFPIGPFADQGTVQAAIDTWVYGYNHSRPPQVLAMATPATVFRPAPAKDQQHKVHVPEPADEPTSAVAELLVSMFPSLLSSPRLPVDEFAHSSRRIRSGHLADRLALPAQNPAAEVPRRAGGRTATIWADERSIHAFINGELSPAHRDRSEGAGAARRAHRRSRVGRPRPGRRGPACSRGRGR
ncbi:hypothetical protein [Streptomyces syringium]|uniref:hypothetical protein n=1 Tax=Streptomyces syringium TaxID=76729 RepID=UPI00343F984E